MMSGMQAIAELSTLSRDQQSALGDLDTQAEALQQQIRELMQRRGERLKALARVHISLLDEAPLAGALDAAEQRVVELLGRRDAAAAEVARKIEQTTAAKADLEARRERLRGELEAAAEVLDNAEAAVQTKLDADAAYRAQRERTAEAERIAQHAETKAGDSEAEEQSKGAAYRDDPLFMYLWRRRFGTAEYRGRGLFRWLDGKVARLIGYEDVRLNYQRLAEIPLRLRDYAKARREAADAEYGALRQLDDDARAAAGIPGLEHDRDAAQLAVDDNESRLETAEAELAGLLAQRSAFAAGEDEHSQRAVEQLAETLQREDLATLEREAAQTPFPEDDRIVAELKELEREQRRHSFLLENLKQTRAKHQEKLEDLARLRRDLQREGMHRPGGSFGDAAVVAMMLTNFVKGVIDRDALMRVLEEQYRYRPPRTDPTFGSGGFGHGSPWGGGMAGRSSRMPSSRGGGGFRSGGGFGGGGGGFRTGGGF
ncbi:hypothetical protein [Thiohalocapsa sp. ML1]|jgi:hypothetical protein|uniref:hypothetical protein n=1 Tax=Thiohalocapsa sp. ML1 TaxID=1431688 RepID=UPI0007323AD1|nr:hypothetical protein [Thiohalocapsa sp. ML1]